MTSPQHAGRINLRRSDDNERFVAFAFSAAEMLVETDAEGVASFAAGAFRTHFGRPSDSFNQTNIRDMIAPIDHETLEEALCQLAERGRVSPFIVRLANADRTPIALSGIALPAPGRPPRFCLSFARLPAAAPGVLRAGAGKALSQGGRGGADEGRRRTQPHRDPVGVQARAVGEPGPRRGARKTRTRRTRY